MKMKNSVLVFWSLSTWAQVGQGASCDSEQAQCVSQREAQAEALLIGPSTCLDVEGAFADVVSCLGFDGCEGIDLTAAKQSCRQTSCSCDALEWSRNALGNESVTQGAHQISPDAQLPFITASKRASVNHLEKVDETGTPSIKVQWIVPLQGEQAVSLPVPLLNGNIALAVNGGKLLCFDRFGDLVWSFSGLAASSSVEFSGSPVVAEDGTLFVGDTAGFLYQIDESTGVALRTWNLGSGGVRGSVAITQGFVFAVTKGSIGFGSTLHKLSRTEEKSLTWRAPICDHSSFLLDWVQQGVVLSSTDVLVSCPWQGFLDAFDLSTGEPSWSVKLANATEVSPVILHAPVLDQAQNIYTITQQSLVRMSGVDGSIDWTLASDDSSQFSQVALNESAQVGWVATTAGALIKFSMASGQVLAQSQVGVSTTDAPLLDGGESVLLGVDGDIVILNSDTLNETATVPVGASVRNGFVSTEGKLYATSDDASLLQVAATPSVLESGMPTRAPSTSPTTMSAVPTSAPTSQVVSASQSPTQAPTVLDDAEGNTNTNAPTSANQDDEEGWPRSAKITVGTLAALDGVLIIAAGVLAIQRSKGATPQQEQEMAKTEDGITQNDEPSSPTATGMAAA